MWLPGAVYGALEAGAGSAGVETGAVAREAILRAHAGVLADVSAGRVKLRARSARLPVAVAERKPSGVEVSTAVSSSAGSCEPAGDASAALPRSAPLDLGVERALAFRRVAARQAAERRGS